MSAPTTRWLIPDPEEEPSTAANWERIHEEGYVDVFSVSEDKAVRERLIVLTLQSEPQNVLLIGCGSRTDVQREILASGDSAMTVVAADFERVISIAESSFKHPRLTYVTLDQLDRQISAFDCVLAVNVAVSGSDITNRRMIHEWSQMLTSTGKLISLMPIFTCGLEWAQLTGRADIERHLSIERTSWFEEKQEASQVEYLPLRLRRLLLEAGLEIERLEIVFLADEHSRRETARVYGLDDPDLLVYEQLVVAVRRPSVASEEIR